MVPSHAAHTIAIVGGGAIGAALFGILVEELAADASLAAETRVVLFERSERVGPGLAYAKDDSPYVLNQSAQTMSLVPRARGHFCAWLARRGLASADARADLFCARRTFGDYVEEHFADAREKARRAGIAVSVVRDEVTALAPRRSGGARVSTHAHAPIDADLVVLALGHLPSTRFAHLADAPGFVATPYPGDAMCARVAKDARVAVIGSGLSAIDAVLALLAAGRAAPITMASRSGLLPAVRGPLPQYTLRHVTRANVARETDHGKKPLRWTDVVRWLRAELEQFDLSLAWDRDFPAHAEPLAYYEAQVAAAEHGPRPWQAIGEALNPMIEVVWHHLADDDKRLFLDRFYSRFMSHWVPIPLVNARPILGHLRAQRLTVEKDLDDVSRDGDGFRLGFADGRAMHFDFVVDATGTPRHLAECDSPLVSALLRAGIVSANEFGGVRVDFESLRVLDEDGAANPHVFALGNLTSGTHLFTSTLEQNVEKADRIAAQIVSELHRRSARDHSRHVDASPHST